MARSKTRIKADQKKELQGAAAFIGMMQIYERGVEMDIGEQKLELERILHGKLLTKEGLAVPTADADEQQDATNTNEQQNIPLLHLAAIGDRHFRCLYIDTHDGLLQLNPLYCRFDDFPLVVGKNITLEVLERATFTSLKMVTGRSGYEKAQRIAANLRKMYSIIYNHIKEGDRTPKNSGGNWPLAIDNFLAEFHELTKNDAILLDDSDDDDDDEDDSAAATKTRPPKKIPEGLLTFFCVGPFPWCRHQECNLGKFDKDPTGSEKKKSSRKALRADKQAHDDFERSRDIKRGKPEPSMAQQLLKQIIEGRNDYSEFAALETKLIMLTSRADRLVKLLTVSTNLPPNTAQEYHSQLKEIEARIEAVTKQMDEFNARKAAAAATPSSNVASSSTRVTAESSSSASASTSASVAQAENGEQQRNLDDVARVLNPATTGDNGAGGA